MKICRYSLERLRKLQEALEEQIEPTRANHFQLRRSGVPNPGTSAPQPHVLPMLHVVAQWYTSGVIRPPIQDRGLHTSQIFRLADSGEPTSGLEPLTCSLGVCGQEHAVSIQPDSVLSSMGVVTSRVSSDSWGWHGHSAPPIKPKGNPSPSEKRSDSTLRRTRGSSPG